MSRRPNGNGFNDPRVVPFRRPPPKKPVGGGWRRPLGLFAGLLASGLVVAMLFGGVPPAIRDVIVALAFAVIVTIGDIVRRRKGL